ncbi:MAG: 4-hydroxyproline epimerase [Flavobacteriia bacterium]|nr:4-hydroxyproline epimerase [Flavobacteriia bacterium]OIP46084.1 MAG: hydroxyproline-2-epimerase [Flavobacteriaceae bacterium CG2_30_31_66]PIV96888.1 MAG: hydroxyproline-2-epimerase [Flavobacteriaceae bacterium CG17_big_fil_post_rev_8_21_14_2_50_31_13]PIX12713.1 MAG: hydroxyproline-2-epimerase [Flavobacteriaceae bacterium CG_4_8_14_3_um_filter_31_8]PIY15195.1 MAG: hydroxyproline-2-epimerase [Flavobacteriaceae bacterium CG_4_10_14_3_um_filter_31_253]PIZ09687.1 MAG: hydroxyproline-2-epimerase 
MSSHTFVCIDAHTCGNPVRVIKSGGPDLVGKTMNEKRLHFLQEFDWIRKGLMFEPRGHDMMSGSILYPPHNPENDFAILFIETSGCLPMCGHGTIGTITIAIEEGLITPKTPGKIKMEAPAGLVEIEYSMKNDKVEWVKLTNVKSYLAAENLTIDCPELGEITFDVSYGGNFYAIVDPQKNFSGIQDFTASKIVQYSQVVRERINQKYPNWFVHPENESIKNVTHLLWTGTPINQTSHGRNAVFYGDKAIDRSPCGTGTSARLAQLYAKGKLKIGEKFIHESFIGSTFIGCVEQETTIGGKLAIIPSIQGWAKIYGHNIITIDTDDDPYAFGFSVI